MGISGLTSFMDDNLQLLQEHRLRQSKIVIDGNNLYHLLYYDYNVDFVHGGDYDKFAAKTREFFVILTSCGISPYVVFDGGYEVDDRKLKTILQRNQQRLISSHNIARGSNGKILPILAYETFRQVLVDIGVPFVVSDFEADYDIAVLANDLNCPVLSFDSDFYIFPLHAGFIPFDSVNFTVQASDEDKCDKYLLCRIYFVDKLTKHFPSLGRDVLPLLATLMGNDYIEPSMFEVFVAKLPSYKESCKSFRIPKTKTRLMKYVNWLETVGSLSEAVDQIVSAAWADDQERVRRKTEKSLHAFTLSEENCTCRLIKYFMHSDTACGKPETDGYGGISVPNWVKAAHRTGDIVMAFKNVLLLRRIFLQCQVEDIKLPSSYRCSRKIREVMYGILLLDMEKEVDEAVCVQEYDRDFKNVKKNLVHPVERAHVLKLSQIPGTSIEQRQRIILDAHGVTAVDLLSQFRGLELLLCAILHWVRNSEPKISQDHLKSLLVCLVFLHFRSHLENSAKSSNKNAENFDIIHEAIQKSTTDQTERLNKNLGKFCAKPEHCKRNPIDISIIHAFSQFQTCLLAAIHLNQLLLHPFPTPNPALTFKGVFVYNLGKELQKRSNTDLYLREMLIRSSPIHSIYEQILSFVLHEVRLEELQPCTVQSVSKRKKKSKSGKGSSGKLRKETVSDTSEGEECSEKQPDVETQANCSLNNRFSALNIS